MGFLRAFSIFWVVVLVGCSAGDEQTTLDRVEKTKTLTAGYIAYPPSFIVDPNSQNFSGISHDVLAAAAAERGWTIDFAEELGWGSMIEAVNSGRVDIIATAIWPTEARSEKADFLTPIYLSVVKAYVRSDDDRFDGNLSMVDDENIRISVIDGEMSATIAESDYPNAKQVSLTQMNDVSQVLLQLTTNKADITFVEPAIALEFLAKNPGSIREVADIDPVRVFTNNFMVKKGDTELEIALNETISGLIMSGKVDEIIDRYEKYPGSFERVK